MITTIDNYKILLQSNLNENNRSTYITFNKAKEYIKNSNLDISNIFNIYRGIKGDNHNFDFKYINPKNNIRKSANTFNYYTLFMDNNKLWENYPKRSQSIICSTNAQRALEYGKLYLVIPLNKYAKFGICSKNDLWYSFNYLTNICKNTSDLHSFNLRLKSLNITDNSYDEMMKVINSLNKELNKVFIKTDKKNIFNFFKSNKNSYKFNIEDLLSPIKNNFKLIEYYNLKNETDLIDKEVWTDSECLLINILEDKNIIEKLFN